MDKCSDRWFNYSGKSLFAEHMKLPKASQEDNIVESSSEEDQGKDAVYFEPELDLENLPKDIKEAITTVKRKLELGDLEEAREALLKIMKILRDGERFDECCTIDLSFERLLYNRSRRFEKELPPFKHCQLICFPSSYAGCPENLK